MLLPSYRFTQATYWVLLTIWTERYRYGVDSYDITMYIIHKVYKNMLKSN